MYFAGDSLMAISLPKIFKVAFGAKKRYTSTGTLKFNKD
jgi:hypothetical protein